VVFVDFQAFQGTDALGLAVSTMARDLATNLIDADAVTGELGRRRVLVILDNLEDVGEPGALLEAAIAWSEAGQSRVLITTRPDDFGHSRYGRSGYEHQLIPLAGLGTVADPEDAIDYFQGLMRVPPVPSQLPSRANLIKLFGMVDFHPLSIALVAEQLRTWGIVDVIKALDRLLGEVPAGQWKDRSLIASLNLSLERLDAGARELVKCLGVFQGGAMESELLAITEFTPEQWQPLRRQLESAMLLRTEDLTNVSVPFLKFHPTLARVLWANLGEGAQGELQQRHRERYYALSGWLYQSDHKNPYETRAIAQRELPNLLVAVRGALAAGEEWAVEFVDKVNRFLNILGMNADRADLNQGAMIAAQSMAVGSRAWYLARTNLGEQLCQAGQVQAAAAIFQEILAAAGETVSYERCITLGRLGRCGRAMGHPDQAAMLYRQALDALAQLELSDTVQRQMGVTQADLADLLMIMGDCGAARQAYEASLAIAEELDDNRLQGAINGNLGTLAMLEGNFDEAAKYHQSSLTIFRDLDEPEMEATAWHQLGMVYERANAWEQAEQAYRAASKLWDGQGNLANAAKTANQLAMVCEGSGNLQDAEAWYRKALKVDRDIGNMKEVASDLNNLANLLQTQGGCRLPEARQLAEESLALKQTLDPAAAAIWKIYSLLSKIATQQGEAAKAQDYRRLSRQSYSVLAVSQHMLQQWEELIQGVVVAMSDAEVHQQVEEAMPQWPAAFATAIQRILAGVRDEDELCDELGYEDGAIVVEILGRLSA
jgi:tetratricopeptide (TPR) repeat protein